MPAALITGGKTYYLQGSLGPKFLVEPLQKGQRPSSAADPVTCVPVTLLQGVVGSSVIICLLEATLPKQGLAGPYMELFGRHTNP